MKLLVDLNDEVYNNMVVKNEYTRMDVIAVHNALMGAKRIQEDIIDEVLEIIDSYKFGSCWSTAERLWNENLDKIKKEILELKGG